MKTISFAIPCYNSAEYMDKCIESIMACGGAQGTDDIEIIIVDDGSVKDNTAEKADEWQARHPGVIKAVHQENGGHGQAVNPGLANATGLYFKVVDSDDWLDRRAMEDVMAYVRSQMGRQAPTDLVIANYVYEKVHENTRTVMHYRNVFPEGREFGWADVVPLLHRARGPKRERVGHDEPYRSAAARHAHHDRRCAAALRRGREAPGALHGELPVHDDVHLLHLPAHD